MTRKDYIADLVKRYLKADHKWDMATWEGEEKFYEGQVEMLEDILGEIYGFKDLWTSSEGILMNKDKEVK